MVESILEVGMEGRKEGEPGRPRWLSAFAGPGNLKLGLFRYRATKRKRERDRIEGERPNAETVLSDLDCFIQ